MARFQYSTIREKVSKIKLPRIRALNKWTLLAALSYLNVLVVFPLLLAKKNDFVRYHSVQGLVLLLFTAIAVFSFYLPVLPWILFLYIVFCILFGLWNVFTSKERKLPLLGRFY